MAPSLLTLPVEILDKIVRYLVVSDEALVMRPTSAGDSTGKFEALEFAFRVEDRVDAEEGEEDDGNDWVESLWNARLVVRDDSVWQPLGKVDDVDFSNVKYTSDLGIFFVSRALYEQVAPIFWGINEFHFDTCREFVLFFRKLGYAAKSLIRHVSLVWTSPLTKAAFDCLRKFPSLRCLTLEIRQFNAVQYMAGPKDERRFWNKKGACDSLKRLRTQHFNVHGDAEGLDDWAREMRAVIAIGR